MTTKLLNKIEIIKKWSRMIEKNLNEPTCPHCRDNLVELLPGEIYCSNLVCLNMRVYAKKKSKNNEHKIIRNLTDQEKKYLRKGEQE